MESTMTEKVQQWHKSQIEGDMGPFDRQLRISGWKQDQIESSVCLLLGSGGLGCGVAMGLARLGVKKIILVDKDYVDTNNLNRQILFSYQHVGMSKCEAAKKVLMESHRINPLMEVETYVLDALKQWQTIVKLCDESTVVFNMIDVGEYFDAAVSALCM